MSGDDDSGQRPRTATAGGRRPARRRSRPRTASCRPSTASRSTSTAARCVAIVGESGSGKSVTAMTLMGLTRGPNARIEGTRDARRPGAAHGLRASSCRRIRGGAIAMVFQDPMSSLDPVYRVGTQIVEQIRAHDRKVSKAEAMDRAVELMERVGIPRARGAAALLPARVLRRHAPARDDRDGAVLLAEAADRRRADDRARRDDPGADPRRAARAARARPAPGSSSSPTTSASSPTSPTAWSSCTPGGSSSRARSTSSSTTPSTPTRGACSARSRAIDRDRAAAPAGDRRAAAVAAATRPAAATSARAARTRSTSCTEVPALSAQLPGRARTTSTAAGSTPSRSAAADGRRPDRARRRAGDRVSRS